MTRFGNLIIAGAVLSTAAITPTSAEANVQLSEPFIHAELLRDGEDAGRVRRNNDGRDRPAQDYYPGAEHVDLAHVRDGGIDKVLLFGMGSYTLNGAQPNNRVQMFCAPVRLDPIAGPVLESNGYGLNNAEGPFASGLRYVTNNNGNRYRNAHRPRAISIFGGEAVAVLYNYAPNNHAITYMTVFGPNCERLSARTQVMAKNNDNCSNSPPGSVVALAPEGNSQYLAGGYGCDGNGRDSSWLGVQRITKNLNPERLDRSYTVNVMIDNVETEANEERTRPMVMVGPDNRFVTVCLTAGNNQPPANGVRCSAYNIETGQRLWRQYIARREGGIYQTQIQIVPIADQAGNVTDTALAHWTMITQRRNGNAKGRVVSQTTALRFTYEGVDILAPAGDGALPTMDPTHAGICGGQFGIDEAGGTDWRAILIGGSINGNPNTLSTAQTVAWNYDQRRAMPDRSYGLPGAIDSGWLSNIYGQNPNNQGRNFISCIGDVPNPGYQVTDGYQTDVKSFVAVAATTRRMRTEETNGYLMAEDKLATELILIPAVVAPDAPLPGDPVDPSDPVPDPDDNNPTDPGTGPGGTGGTGGCSVGGSAGAGSLALLGLALLGFRRRRSR
jgi:MYXO-CTERM domain-containing protein